MSRGSATALTGIAYVVLAGACFALIDTAAKFVIATVPVLMALWVRYMLQAIVSTAVLLPVHGRSLWRTGRFGLQVLRGVLLITSSIIAFVALSIMPVGEFTAIVMVTPLSVTVVAVVVLKTRIAPLHWLFVVGGFAGTLIIIRPGGQGLGWPALLPLACMVVNSGYQLLSSYLGRSENPATTHFYTAWVGAVLASLVLPFAWVVVDSPWLWFLMVVMGVLGALGHFLLATAYKHAPAATLMPYIYCQLGFAVLATWAIFAHVPDALACAGMVLIALCGIGGAWLTAYQNRAPRTP